MANNVNVLLLDFGMARNAPAKSLDFGLEVNVFVLPLESGMAKHVPAYRQEFGMEKSVFAQLLDSGRMGNAIVLVIKFG